MYSKAKWNLAIVLTAQFLSFQEIQGKGKTVSRKEKTNVNNRTSFHRRFRRDGGQEQGAGVEREITSGTIAVDNICTMLVPCVPGQTEEDLRDNCITYNSVDMHNPLLREELPGDWDTEEIEQKAALCYDTDPDTLSPLVSTNMRRDVNITSKKPKDLNDGYKDVGFAIEHRPVYRYTAATDIYKVKENYEDTDGPVDFEFMEWPGKTVDSLLLQYMVAQRVSEVNQELGAVKECMQVLEFQGRSNKYLDYMCNTDEGLDISAVGLIERDAPIPEETYPLSCSKDKLGLSQEHDEDDFVIWEETYNRVYNLRCNLPKNRDNAASECATWPTPGGKIYLASGNMSLLGDYIQPLLVSEAILRKLVQPPDLSLDPVYVPQFGGERIQCTDLESRDIRTVLDFAFSSDRLILGMKCGIILVKNINQEELEFDVAYLRVTDRQRPSVNESRAHLFPYMINTVAASTCCSTDKVCHLFKPIVAIYSSYAAYREYPSPDPEDKFRKMPKFIYISTDNGDTFDRRVVASPEAEINLMYWMYSKIPKWQIKDARPPDWVKQKVFQNDPGLGTDFLEPIDPITNFVMQNVMPDTEDECFEIVSMVVVSEESIILVLCRYKQTTNSRNAEAGTNTYGIFSIKIRGTMPLVSTIRRSKRKFTCKPVQLERYWGLPTKLKYSIEPILVRIPMSYSIFVAGCDKILYYSSNGGRTMFISAFFTPKNGSYVRTYVNDNLTQQPLIALDSQGQSVMMTSGSYFSYGVISTNTEISFVSGKILNQLEQDDVNPQSLTFIPFLNDAGKVGAALMYINVLSTSSKIFKTNYAKRFAIRLLDCAVSIHSNALPFYFEKQETSNKNEKNCITPCTTFNFKINKTAMFLDVGESDAVKVSVLDTRKETPLNILLTHDKAASLEVYGTDEDTLSQTGGSLLHHGWEIKLTAKPYIIPRMDARVNAFFGASYSNFEEVSAHLIISTQPQMRCHVQPRGHLQVRFGCSKKLKIHEDERRPHCEKFQKNFKYKIPQGNYDEDMANYWILERPKFYKIVDGTLEVTYDYEMFGCPVQPYRLDPYFPDLRILPRDGSSNTTEGVKFNGSFVLIEIFGASGYSFDKKVRDQNCVIAPQTLERMMEEWKVRTEAIKSIWYDYPHFDFESVYHPLNIWNRVNYEACQGNQFINEEEAEIEEEADYDEDAAGDLELDVLESPYEVLKREDDPEKQNKLVWDDTIRQDLYIFLAVAVDPYGTFCNHHTIFGLSITVPKEGDDWVVIVVFFLSLLILTLLVIAGYYLRRYQVYRHFYKEAMFNHLLTAAWNLTFRYEKMLYDSKVTDPEVKKEMEETRQMKNIHSGVEPAKGKPTEGVEGLRHRLRQ